MRVFAQVEYIPKLTSLFDSACPAEFLLYGLPQHVVIFGICESLPSGNQDHPLERKSDNEANLSLAFLAVIAVHESLPVSL